MRDDTLIALWDASICTQHRRAHGGRLLPAFDRTELLTLAARWHARIEIDAFAYRNGISYHGVEQLIALGRLSATAPTLPGRAPCISDTEASDFVRQIEKNAAPAIDRPLSLKDAAYAIGGRLKPWGPILVALLDGEIAYSLVEGSQHLVDRIVVDVDHVGRLRDYVFDRSAFPGFRFSDRIVRRDALEALNAGQGDKVLKGLTAQGMNPRTFAVLDVEELARRVIALPEIAFAMSVIPSAAYQRLRRAGWMAIMPGAWDRPTTAPHLELINEWDHAPRKGQNERNLFEQIFMKETSAAEAAISEGGCLI